MSDRAVALVTGASRGIGYAIAEAFAEAGYDLAICGTREETVRAAADRLEAAHGARVLARAVDVSKRDEIQGLVADTAAHFGRLDVLVNNAGITRDTLAMRMKGEEWQQGEIGSRGITVNAVAPGFIATDMTAELGEEAHKRLVEQIPLARLGEPRDIANAVLFLAGDKAAYITGQVLHVNGGMYM